MRESLALAISESSQIGEGRRAAVALANRLGFNETERGRVGIVVTEAANNLVQHAKRGILLLRAIESPLSVGIEILALDQGPGMHNIDECLRDGFSTAGTSGNGLGAIHRLSGLLDIYSIQNQGTALLAHLWPESAKRPQAALSIGAVCLPKRGETISGDAWASEVNHQHGLLLVADGLGHGPAAATASLEAVRMFRDHHHRPPQAIIEAAHGALRSTRGAAVAVAEIDFEQQLVRFAGVGNIAASISGFNEHHNLVSYNGTVGHEVRKIQEFTYAWQPTSLLIMHSDGLGTQWRLDRYPGLSQKHPSLIAGVLYRDFNRERDDVTVLVAREMRE